VLTGTPLENRLEELVSIVEFVDRHRLGPTFRFLDHHQVRDEGGKVIGYRNLDDVGRTLAPILLRRQKGEVLRELPARLEKRFFVPMTPEQRRHHDENLPWPQALPRWLGCTGTAATAACSTSRRPRASAATTWR
jgi:SNF2 family DNA or RNA helicase